MQDEQVEELITELKALNLRRRAILAQLEEAYSGYEAVETTSGNFRVRYFPGPHGYTADAGGSDPPGQ